MNELEAYYAKYISQIDSILFSMSETRHWNRVGFFRRWEILARLVKCNVEALCVNDLRSRLHILNPVMRAKKRLWNVWKMRFVSRRICLWDILLKMCQQIADALFWKGCKNQNTQTVTKILTIGDLDQQVGICKINLWTLYSFDMFFEDF